MNLPSPQFTGRGVGIPGVTLGSLRLSASATVTRAEAPSHRDWQSGVRVGV